MLSIRRIQFHYLDEADYFHVNWKSKSKRCEHRKRIHNIWNENILAYMEISFRPRLRKYETFINGPSTLTVYSFFTTFCVIVRFFESGFLKSQISKRWSQTLRFVCNSAYEFKIFWVVTKHFRYQILNNSSSQNKSIFFQQMALVTSISRFIGVYRWSDHAICR